MQKKVRLGIVHRWSTGLSSAASWQEVNKDIRAACEDGILSVGWACCRPRPPSIWLHPVFIASHRVDCRFLLVPFPSVKGKHLRHTSYNWWSLLSGFILSIIKKMCCPIRRNQCPLYCKQHVVWYICLITQILTAGNLVLKQPSPVCLFFSVILLKPDNLVCLCIFFISFFGDFPLY